MNLGTLSVPAILALALTASASADDLKVRFDCYFRVGPITCQELQDAYFSAFPYFKEALSGAGDAPGEPFLSITLRSFPAERGYNYQFDFTGKDTLPKFTLGFFESDALAPAALKLSVLKKLEAGTVPFTDIVMPAKTNDGVTSLEIGAPDTSTPAQKSTTGWYTTLGTSASYKKGDTESISIDSDEIANYSTPAWRMNGELDVYYERVKVHYADQAEEQEVTTVDADFVAAKMIANHWSVAVLPSFSKDRSNNIDSKFRANVGIEWVLVPFLTTGSYSASIHYEIGEAYERYVNPNVLGESQMKYVQHWITAYTDWHFSRVDLSGSANIASPIRDYRFLSSYANGGLTYRLTKKLQLTGSGRISYRRALTNEPAQSEVTDGLQEYLAGGNYAKFTVKSSLSISYSFGNAGIYNQDMRWR